MQRTAPSNIVAARIIAGSAAAGAVLFWVVAWVMSDGGAAGIAPDALPPAMARLIWAAVAVSAFGAALVFRGRALRVVEGLRAGYGEPSAGRPEDVPTNLAVAWTLLESSAPLAGVFFLLLGTRDILFAAALVHLLGFAVTFPRADWYVDSGAREMAET